MARIGLSTAAFCLWDITAQEKLEICSTLGFEEIQIALSSEKMVVAFLDYLNHNQFDYAFKKVALHAPWCGVHYGDGAKSMRVFTALKAIHEKLQLDTVIIRVDNIVKADVLKDTGLPISIENSHREGAWEHFQQIANQTELPITLNINRAVRHTDYLDELLSVYGARINRILLSGFSTENGRMPLQATNQWVLLDRVKALNLSCITTRL